MIFHDDDEKKLLVTTRYSTEAENIGDRKSVPTILLICFEMYVKIDEKRDEVSAVFAFCFPQPVVDLVFAAGR